MAEFEALADDLEMDKSRTRLDRSSPSSPGNDDGGMGLPRTSSSSSSAGHSHRSMRRSGSGGSLRAGGSRGVLGYNSQQSPPWDVAKEWQCALASLLAMLLVLVVAMAVGSSDADAAAGSPKVPLTSGSTWGAIYRSGTSASRAKSHLEFLTRIPHVAGTTGDNVTAKYVEAQFHEAGVPEVSIEEFSVLLSLPAGEVAAGTGATVQLVPSGSGTPAACNFTAKLHEDTVPGDPVTADDSRPYPFHGYAPSGDATAPAVYANYGTEDDYQALESAGISVNGSVVICRYGKVFRGNKVYSAQIRGAVAVIIYSDPIDAGSDAGPVYPDGPWRPASGVQRGSVYLGEGDPLTPNMPADVGSLRLTIDEASDPGPDGTNAGWALPLIPSIPISAEDAAPIMQNIAAAATPVTNAGFGDTWQGGLGFPYGIGPSSCGVRVKTVNLFRQKSIWNVMGKFPGNVEPDRVIVVGNHRDAWVAGAVDPSGGTTALLETAHALGRAYRAGWRPRRTVILASWDAEEYGLVGSTEFVEKHVHTLSSQAVAYLNLDEAVSSMGRIFASASPALSSAVWDASKHVLQPACPPNAAAYLCDGLDVRPGETLYEFWLRKAPQTLSKLPQEARSPAPVPQVESLGSGSDYTGFLEHIGVASLDLVFGGVNGGYYAVYHSVYDDADWVKKFGDPLFAFHKSAAELLGTIVLNLATDMILPMRYVEYARAFVAGAKQLREAAVAAGGAVGPPTRSLTGEFSKTVDVDRLDRVITAFSSAALQLEKEKVRVLASFEAGTEASTLALRRLNDVLMLTERAFILPEGLPGRPWYKHVVYSPSETDYYGSTLFPGVNDALSAGKWRLSQKQLDVVCHLIQRATDGLVGGIP